VFTSHTKSGVISYFCREDIKKIYKIEEVLGSGTYGKVRSARLIRDPTQKYAIKSLSRQGCKLDVLENEFLILKKLDHPNLVRLHELYRDDRYFYFVTEYLSGGELFNHVLDRGAISEKESCQITSKLVQGIQYLHE
jgi:serine/threonine protein kinase